MKIAVIGGGPAGLYFSILMKLADSSHQITVYERNARGNTFGWGVVFSDETINNFLSADPTTSERISASLYHWDDIHVYFKEQKIASSGHGFSGIARKALLEILTARAEELGVEIEFGADVEDFSALSDKDLIVAADGIFSRTRESYAEFFKPDIDWRHCKYIWMGTEKLFDAFSFFFEKTEFGWFQAHCYRFSEELSTFIVECPEEVWRAAGIDKMSKDEGVKFCEQLFGKYLDGKALMTNNEHLRGSAAWINFPRVNCERWYHKNIVLLGDSAATAHFSIGSGTKLAMESAICLARMLNESDDLETLLPKYQEERRVEVLKLQSAARNSTEWFENVNLKAKLDPEQFAYSLLTRSQRVSHENLRVRDKDYLEGVERWFAQKSGTAIQPMTRPPMLAPFQLRGMELVNRIVVSPMDMYSARDGMPGDFHLVHLGARALGGAGLIFTEMTCVSPEGRISPGCAGIYTDEQAAAWKRIVDFVHSNSPAKVALQLGHCGRKGSTRVAWEGMDLPLEQGNWPVYGPSPIPYSEKNQTPLEMSAADMQKVKDDFVSCAKRGADAGFDMLEVHCAHGYLLSTFISPLCNQRTDDYGGSLENRLRFPLEVFDAVRDVWPKDRPMSVRISATDWVEGGISIEDSIEVARAFDAHGADIIDVSAGQVSKDQKPVYGRMFQTPFADRIRAELGIATMAVGNIFEPDHVNSILAAGRADLCLLARPHLADSQWTLHAAAQLGYKDQWWPKQYLAGKDQLYRLVERAKAAQEGPI
ncbi:MAG: bifunctional salicylyl-CoA 5-hydroxylase/oxidoreductase [Bdellovibrionales bacterium]|nr:bifunctional salicylyl-CoA 5-hydroxylase/oxidoreductase [Bdellovibrionales bacterium]